MISAVNAWVACPIKRNSPTIANRAVFPWGRESIRYWLFKRELIIEFTNHGASIATVRAIRKKLVVEIWLDDLICTGLLPKIDTTFLRVAFNCDQLFFCETQPFQCSKVLH